MEKNIVKSLLVVAVAMVSCVGVVSADMSGSASIDFSSLHPGVSQFQLVFTFSDNDGISPSYALIDNVSVVGTARSETSDFGDVAPDLDGFQQDASTRPGSLPNDPTGYALQMLGDQGTNPLLVYRDYLDLGTAVSLSFDFALIGDDSSLVVSIVDPDPASATYLYGIFAEDLNPSGMGDVLAISPAGVESIGDVTLNIVPVPAALLLGLLGFGSAGLGLWTRLARSR